MEKRPATRDEVSLLAHDMLDRYQQAWWIDGMLVFQVEEIDTPQYREESLLVREAKDQ